MAPCGGLCGRGLAPLETFTRSQLAAISLIFMVFHDFHSFSKDFMTFHAGCWLAERKWNTGFQGRLTRSSLEELGGFLKDFE